MRNRGPNRAARWIRYRRTFPERQQAIIGDYYDAAVRRNANRTNEIRARADAVEARALRSGLHQDRINRLIQRRYFTSMYHRMVVERRMARYRAALEAARATAGRNRPWQK